MKQFGFEFTDFLSYFVSIILGFLGLLATTQTCKIPSVGSLIKQCIPPGLGHSQHLAIIDVLLPLAVQPN